MRWGTAAGCSMCTSKPTVDGGKVITTALASHINEKLSLKLCAKYLSCVISFYPLPYSYDAHMTGKETEARRS